MTEPRTWTIKRKRGVGGHAQVAGPDCDWVRVAEVGPELAGAINEAREAWLAETLTPGRDHRSLGEFVVARLTGENTDEVADPNAAFRTLRDDTFHPLGPRGEDNDVDR